jgi:type IV pilus assembly protein PilW
MDRERPYLGLMTAGRRDFRQLGTQGTLGSQGGLTLMEAMVALTITGLVVASAYSVLYSSQRTQTLNEQAVGAQQHARIAMELIAQDLKDAGFNAQALSPPGIDLGGVAGSCGVNGLVPLDNNPTGNDTGPDSVSMIVPVNLSTLQLAITGTAPTAEVVLASGSLLAAAQEGFGLAPYATPFISLGGYAVATVIASDPATDKLTLREAVRLPKDAQMPIGLPVYWLQCVMYKVIHPGSDPATEQPLCGGVLPCLVRGTPPCVVGQPGLPCVPVVEGIEDLQLAYACDGCGAAEDGVIDDQTGGQANQFDEGDFVSNSTWSAGSFTPRTIRLARVTVVARQVGVAMGAESASQGAKATFTPLPLQVEDHRHADGVFMAGDLGTATALRRYQEQQRRVLTRVVQLRNMGLF